MSDKNFTVVDLVTYAKVAPLAVALAAELLALRHETKWVATDHLPEQLLVQPAVDNAVAQSSATSSVRLPVVTTDGGRIRAQLTVGHGPQVSC